MLVSHTPDRTFALALASIALIGPLAVHLYLPVIPAIKAALGISDALAQLTFSVSLFGMAFATLFYGSLSDRYGRRPVLLSGLALFLFGSVVSLVAETANALVLGRLVQAIGAGCALTLVRAIARDAYRAEQLVMAIAYLTEFGLYFLLFPVGFFVGNFISTRVGNRVSTETMIMVGSVLTLVTVLAQAVALTHGLVTPLSFFVPGFFITMAQGVAMPYAQVG